MTNERESESGGPGMMRSFEEYRARVFPNETDRRRFDSNDRILGVAEGLVQGVAGRRAARQVRHRHAVRRRLAR